MHAIQVTPPAAPVVAEVAEPVPAEGEALVRVLAATVSPSDALVGTGAFHEAGFITRPTVGLGWDVIGEVLDPGGRADLAVGDRVAGLSDTFDRDTGTLADRIALPAVSLAHVPVGLDTVDAALVPLNGLTAWQALDALGDALGTLLVTGAAGQVGGYALTLARRRGFDVTGLARPTDRAFVESTGAGFTNEPTGAFDAVLDTAGLGAEALRLVRDGGRYVGVLPGQEPATERGVDVRAVFVHADGPALGELLDLAAAGELRPRLESTTPFDGALAALAAALTPGRRGRTVIVR